MRAEQPGFLLVARRIADQAAEQRVAVHAVDGARVADPVERAELVHQRFSVRERAAERERDGERHTGPAAPGALGR